MERLTGIGASPGVALGPALVAVQRDQAVRFTIPSRQVSAEVEAFAQARLRSKEQLVQIRARMLSARAGELVALFDAQLLMLDDPLLINRTIAIIRETCANGEWAIQQAVSEVASVLDGAADPYLRERKGDLHDVAGRLSMNLREDSGGVRALIHQLDRPCVLIADELTPSVVAQLDWTRVAGFATDAGSRTYHTAILARSLGVPAVVGLADISRRVQPGAIVLLDGETGAVTVEPDEALRRSAVRPSRKVPVVRTPPGPLFTRDGVAIHLLANIDRVEDVPLAVQSGAIGVGLYRSEFLLAGLGPELIDEDYQYRAYRRLIEAAGGRPVTIRTFDIDGRHFNRSAMTSADAPGGRWVGHGGLRGIRASLADPAQFGGQLRAILRASAHGPAQVMFPFVSSVEEVRAARQFLEEQQQMLGGAAAGPLPVGVMIELPAAAMMASALSREVDFFAIGTNDLIQYTLGVDRTDERVSNRYQPLHPAVLRLIRLAQRASTRAHRPLTVCGEMASDPALLQLLIGCGLTAFSMTPGALDMARVVIEATDARQAKAVAVRALRLGTVDEIEEHLRVTLGHVPRREAAETAKE